MKRIVILGAGKSAIVLIDYFKKVSTEKKWQVIVADYNLIEATHKVGLHEFVKATLLDVHNTASREKLIQSADIIISLIPPQLHYIIALDCIKFNKHLLTASYITDDLKQHTNIILDKGLLFLCEMGLDPGIDHMSAMKIIDNIHSKGGKITSFKSHCGGLIAPKSDTNPWHYKISWNPRNIVTAGKAGAVYKEENVVITKPYEALFSNCMEIFVDELGIVAYYPNRDSLSYIPLYGLNDAATFIRTTLRHSDFCKGWVAIVGLGLTNELNNISINSLTVSNFFKNHIATNQLEEALSDYLKDSLLNQLLHYLLIDNHDYLTDGNFTVADIFQFIIEKKLALSKDDKDMIVMLHEIEYELNGISSKIKSQLIVKGENHLYTAMAKTVGLPLGIAATLILEGKIIDKGLLIPTNASIYEPVLKALESFDIKFIETITSA